MTETHGWPSGETWQAFNWLTADEDTYQTVRGMTAAELADWLTAQLPSGDAGAAGWLAEVAEAAAERIDWQRLAEALAD